MQNGFISRLANVHFNHYPSHPSVRGQLVKMLISLEPHGIFGSIFAYICMSLAFVTVFLMDEGSLSNSRAVVS